MIGAAILVDANVLWKSSLRNQLTGKVNSGQLQVFVPTLAHAERVRQIADEKGESFAIHIIQQLVEVSGFQLLPFSDQDAETVADVWLILKSQGKTHSYWRAHRFDILLCAVAQSRGYTFITDDKGEHFELISSRMTTTELQSWLEQM